MKKTINIGYWGKKTFQPMLGREEAKYSYWMLNWKLFYKRANMKKGLPQHGKSLYGD